MDSNNAALVAQRNKRKRVARMKKFIVSFLAIWIFVSIIAMTILSVRVVMLQKEINLLTKRIAVIETEKVESMEYMFYNCESLELLEELVKLLMVNLLLLNWELLVKLLMVTSLKSKSKYVPVLLVIQK